MKVVRFNTNRIYSKHGQRITVLIDEETGSVYFTDYDRMIDGVLRDTLPARSEFLWRTTTSSPVEIIAEYVMARYDRCQYDHIKNPEARECFRAESKRDSEFVKLRL